MAQVPRTLSGQAESAYLVQRARQFGLDPGAVLSVASVEEPGLTNAIGDYGTSFGPFQLHAGGSLPAEIFARGADFANQWANSPQGIDYGLAGEAKVAHGLSGAAAIRAIVGGPGYGFERPANPAAEVSTAEQRYGMYSEQVAQMPDTGRPNSFTGRLQYGIGSGLADINSVATHIPGVSQIEGAGSAAISGVSGAVSSVASVGSFLGKLVNPVTWERAIYVVGGFVLIGGGLFIVAKEIGANEVARTVAPIAKAARIAK